MQRGLTKEFICFLAILHYPVLKMSFLSNGLRCLDRNERAFRVISAFWRVMNRIEVCREYRYCTC